MKIIAAPDSFKDCLSAPQVADAIASALEEQRACGRLPAGTEILRFPVADGGEGTATLLTEALGGQTVPCEVSGPLGTPVEARYGVAGSTAVIEIAEACGLQRLRPEERDPLRTTTRGVGQLLLDARRNGCDKFLVCLGGSATCDGGAGMLEVPGLAEAMRGAQVTLLCDVDNPFLGPDGAAQVFAPQKGASPADVAILEARMKAMASRLARETGTDVSGLPGAGAAGGLGGAFMACFQAKRQSGIDAVLDALQFDKALEGAALVITGEGRSDRQTLAGKAACGVLRRSGDVPVALLAGRIDDPAALRSAGFSMLVEVSPRDLPLSAALLPGVATSNIRSAVARLCETFLTLRAR